MKKVTITDVAKEARVSIKTVSNVINDAGSMRPETRQRVKDTIARLGYTVNYSARSLKTGMTKLVGLAVMDFDQPWASMYAGEIIKAARKRGYGVVIDTYGAGDWTASSRRRTGSTPTAGSTILTGPLRMAAVC